MFVLPLASLVACLAVSVRAVELWNIGCGAPGHDITAPSPCVAGSTSCVQGMPDLDAVPNLCYSAAAQATQYGLPGAVAGVAAGTNVYADASVRRSRFWRANPGAVRPRVPRLPWLWRLRHDRREGLGRLLPGPVHLRAPQLEMIRADRSQACVDMPAGSYLFTTVPTGASKRNLMSVLAALRVGG